MKISTLSGWGRVPRVPGLERHSEDLRALTRGMPLSRGLGRSYGDSSLPAAGDGAVAATTLADRILSFDETTGLLRAEAGLSLRELYKLFLPRRWFVPVTPGTTYVTLGGMVAADVHGKNHHVAGTFGAHVTELVLRVADGRVVRCSPTVEDELFRATIGGMGLTGHILEVTFQMERIASPWIWSEGERVRDIDHFMEALDRESAKWPLTGGWIDCLQGGKRLGRGLLYKSRWATPEEAPKDPPRPWKLFNVPIEMPSFLLSRPSIVAFNALFYRQPLKRGVVSPGPIFYPLDILENWNRLYGKGGLTQHQCVLPREAGRPAVRRFLELLAKKGGASFLCVIKDCGPEGKGLLSFPRPGTSIALDIAVRPDTQQLIDALNEQVIKEGGRIYLAKDAFTRAEHYRAMDPRVDEFLRVRRKWDPDGKLRSAQSIRLFGDAPHGEAAA